MTKTQTNWLAIGLVASFTAALTCLIGNPPHRFGFHCYGLTVYDRVPYVLSDVMIGPDGRVRLRASTSALLTVEEFSAFMGADPKQWPDMVFIGTGYKPAMEVVGEVYRAFPNVNIIIDATPGAIAGYNRFHGSHRVAALIHSTS